MLTRKEKEIGLFFRIAVFLKGLDALLELVGGTLALLVPPGVVIWGMTLLTRHELIEDPHDIVATFLLHGAQHYAISGSAFVAIYLFAHGFVKVFLVIGLLKNKIWAYPTALVVLGLFMLYQMYRYIYAHSLIMLGLTIFDLAVVWLIWREYLVQRAHIPSKKNNFSTKS